MSPRLTRDDRRAGRPGRVPAWLRAVRGRIARLAALGIRVRTLTGGVVLAGALLLGLALVGGIDGVGDRPPDPEPTRSGLGPLTAVQPELQRALLTEADLSGRTEPSAAPTAEPSTTAAPADPGTASPTVAPAGEETDADRDEVCQGLLGDALAGLWQADAPQETTTRHTPRGGGGKLEQLVSVFDPERAPEAYGRLREVASGCDRAATTREGDPMTVLLNELSWSRQESASADEGYATRVILEGEERTLTGWLAVDRLGPVISVLRHLEPAAGATPSPERLESDPDPARTRLAALAKLRALLRGLDE